MCFSLAAQRIREDGVRGRRLVVLGGMVVESGVVPVVVGIGGEGPFSNVCDVPKSK